MSLLEVIQESAIEAVNVEVDGKNLRCYVLPKNFEDRLPHFVGYREGILFVSNETPREYWRFIFAHEVRCVPQIGKCTGHCAAAEKEVVEGMVTTDIIVEYITFRLQFFRGLLDYLRKQEPASPLITEVRETIAYLESMLS